MGFWNKLGKIGLAAAPYVAAPFTGGASLAFAPATQKLGQAWAQSDANKNAAKGIGPSKFDQGLDFASGMAGVAGGAGAMGKFGSSFGAGKFNPGGMGGGSGFMNQLGGIMSNPQTQNMIGGMMQNRGGGTPYNPNQMPQMQNQRYPMDEQYAMPRRDMRTPNLSYPIEQGRREGLMQNPRRQMQMRRQSTQY